MNCGLCNRELGDFLIEEHHMIPKMKKGKETEPVHRICHRKIHATFTEKELDTYYHTFDRLREHEAIQKFVKWVAKKPPSYYDLSVDSNRKKR
jgi:hypothetical protein